MERSTISRNQLINQILQIGHGNLAGFIPLGLKAVQEEPELFGHLIAWNEKKGEVRDSKKALPILALRGEYDAELFENAVAHLCLLSPRDLLFAIGFNRSLESTIAGRVTPGGGKLIKQAVQMYLKAREDNPGWWTRTALQHRNSLKAIYAQFHIKPSQMAQAILFDRKYPKGSVFEKITLLSKMSPLEAAGTIINFKIPFLIASGAVGGIKDKPDIILALLEQMSGAEVINNTENFRRLGVVESPFLKSAFESALERAKKDKRVSTLKAEKAAEKISDKKIASKLTAIKEEKLQQLGGIEGDWLVLGDCSGSMERSVELAKYVASVITQQVKGQVYLVFFNNNPTKYEVTGKTLDDIKQMTSRIRAGGGTACGCGLELMRDLSIVINGIAIVSDGGDGGGYARPLFHEAYLRYVEKMGIEPTVYHLWVPGDTDRMGQWCQQTGIPIQKFDVSGMDYYSIPNLIKTLRTSRFTLIDEIMETPLLTLSGVFATQNQR